MVDRDDVVSRLVRHVGRLLPVDLKCAPSVDSFIREELGLDSMRLISLMFTIEQDFGVDFYRYADRMVEGTTIADVACMIREAISERDAPSTSPE